MTERELVEAAARAGVHVNGLSAYYMEHPEDCPPATVVLGYSDMDERALRPLWTRASARGARGLRINCRFRRTSCPGKRRLAHLYPYGSDACGQSAARLRGALRVCVRAAGSGVFPAARAGSCRAALPWP
ncbi:MAG: hypothetical protein ACLR7U_03185 [Ruthenibacterium lactatiformans]